MIPGQLDAWCPEWRKPRASGDDPEDSGGIEVHGSVNPARAGMILFHFQLKLKCSSKPRASGDDPNGDVLHVFSG